MVRERHARRRQPDARAPQGALRRQAVHGLPPRVRRRRRSLRRERLGRLFRGMRRALCRLRHQASRRLLSLAHQCTQPSPSGLEHRAGFHRRACRRRARPRAALRGVLFRRPRLDLPQHADRQYRRHVRVRAHRGRLSRVCVRPVQGTDRPLQALRLLERHLLAERRGCAAPHRLLLQRRPGRRGQ